MAWWCPAVRVYNGLQVGSEETIAEIQNRYLLYNRHALSYTWKVRACVRLSGFVA